MHCSIWVDCYIEVSSLLRSGGNVIDWSSSVARLNRFVYTFISSHTLIITNQLNKPFNFSLNVELTYFFNLCATIGGIIAINSILESAIY